MKIGDKVTFKRTGQPGTGTIVGISSPKLYGVDSTTSLWTYHYPGWREKLVYTVEYDKPQKPVSFDEYIEMYNKNQQSILDALKGNMGGGPEEEDYGQDVEGEGEVVLNNKMMFLDYLNRVPFVLHKTYPEEDLELL